jgi:DNA-binding CsgD family transcriptional regulator/pimeloyl-ACP methyl ester carboxylesterase
VEPQVSYVRTKDGTSIAYYDVGEGLPVVWMDMPYSHLQYEWRQDQEGDGLLALVASQARLIRYDHRGFGLSDRECADCTFDGYVQDLETVVERCGVTSFVLLATRGPTTPLAIEYAIRHPERVGALIIFNAAASAPELMIKQIRDMLALADGDWRFASEGVSRLVLGWDDEGTSRSLAELLRASTDFEGFACWLDEYAKWDVRPLLPKVATRALLTSTLGHGWYGEVQGREMAADMPDARCFVADGKTSNERVAQTAIAMRDFLGVEPAPQPAEPPLSLQGLTLTDRETEVLRLLASGLTNKAIADRLVLSVRTVETHVAHVYAKLGVTTRVQATAIAINRGMVEP